MKVSAVHLDTTFADISSNEKRAEKYIKIAKEQESMVVVLPEFFTTGFACSKHLIEQVILHESPEEKMKRWAKENEIVVGGSYLAFDGEDIRNTFGVVFPDGTIYRHSKDIPTMLENYAYIEGDTESVFDTPIGRIGVAMCWEQIRYDTVRRMIGKVDFVLAGSCWWGFSDADPKQLQALKERNHKMAVEAPRRLAVLLGVPVVHASHHGAFLGQVLTNPMEQEKRIIYGATQIVDAKGNALVQREYDRPGGVVTADILIQEEERKESLPKDAGYWTIKMPEEFIALWNGVNKSCHSYYEMETKKVWERSCNFADARL